MKLRSFVVHLNNHALVAFVIPAGIVIIDLQLSISPIPIKKGIC